MTVDPSNNIVLADINPVALAYAPELSLSPFGSIADNPGGSRSPILPSP